MSKFTHLWFTSESPLCYSHAHSGYSLVTGAAGLMIPAGFIIVTILWQHFLFVVAMNFYRCTSTHIFTINISFACLSGSCWWHRKMQTCGVTPSWYSNSLLTKLYSSCYHYWLRRQCVFIDEYFIKEYNIPSG